MSENLGFGYGPIGGGKPGRSPETGGGEPIRDKNEVKVFEKDLKDRPVVTR